MGEAPDMSLNEKAVRESRWSPAWLPLSKYSSMLIDFDKGLKKKC